MIIFLEATNMIIKRLEIKNLHGIYNYNVSFNDDLTFIFGENGCGKQLFSTLCPQLSRGAFIIFFRMILMKLFFLIEKQQREAN